MCTIVDAPRNGASLSELDARALLCLGGCVLQNGVDLLQQGIDCRAAACRVGPLGHVAACSWRGLDIDAATQHTAAGASTWIWASTAGAEEPDVVLAAAGDIPTMEAVAAAWWLRRNAPDLRVRVVNVIDLVSLFPAEVHPHGRADSRFVDWFTDDEPVIFAFHGYRRALHAVLHGRLRAGARREVSVGHRRGCGVLPNAF